MQLTPKFIQRNCVEGEKVDLSQANAILKHKPDIIIFELPQANNGVGTIFNRYSCSSKPVCEVDKIINKLKKNLKKYPYVESDIFVWKNINKMWESGINTKIYNVDAPAKMRREFYLFQKPISLGYPAVRNDWLFWIYLYLRDSYMAKNIKKVLDNYTDKKGPTILVFLQSIHWEHVQFLLKNPTKREISEYYFGKFKKLKIDKSIEGKIGERSRILKFYWQKIQTLY